MAIRSVKASEVKPGDRIIIAGEAVLVTSVEPTRNLSGVRDGTYIQTTAGLRAVGKGGEVLVAREEESSQVIDIAPQVVKSETVASRWFSRG